MLQKDLLTFNCSKDNDVESFLRTKAINFEQRHLSRTYLIIDEGLATPEDPAILAYFSLAINYMKINDKVPNRIRKRLNYSTDKPTIPCYLIGQLGKNDNYSGLITGSEIIDYAMSYLVEAQKHVAGCCVRIDCREHEKLLKFYSDNGFSNIQKTEKENYCQLVRYLPS